MIVIPLLVPSLPENLNFLVYDLNAVKVLWSPPAHPNGQITNYKVSYRQNISVDGKN